jgi:hypothetical protein
VVRLDKNPGIIFEMSGFRAGRDAHAMPTLISIPDQIPALTPSTVDVRVKQKVEEGNIQEVSVETEISYRLFNLMTLVTQTL